MFDSDVLAGLTSGQLLDAVARNQNSLREAECSQLLLAAAWADDQERDPADEHPAHVHRSEPRLESDAVAEFGALLGLGLGSARNLIGDAVALRWRFPQIWALVQAAGVPAWQARKVVQATTQLSWDQAAELDVRLAAIIGTMPWPRFQRVLEAAIFDVDPEGVEAREIESRTKKFVRAYDGELGLKLLIARATSGDVAWFMAAVNRIAEILQEDGDADPVDVRRSRAIGILGQPALALRLIATHARPDHAVRRLADDTDPSVPDLQTEPEPVTNEDDETGDAVPQVDPDLAVELTHETLPGPAAALTTALAEIDPRALRPRVVLNFHLGESSVGGGTLVRPEHGGPMSVTQLCDFLGRTGCQVTVRPLTAPAAEAPVDRYEIPERLRRAVRLRDLVDVFPYGTSDLRELDLDHTIPYDPGGPPGQTGLHNLGPLSRGAHRAVTARIVPGGRVTGRWRKRQPSPGVYLWRSPHGYLYLTTNRGTLPLGQGGFADQVWRRAVSYPVGNLTTAA